MKILAICGSPRKGKSYSILNAIETDYPDVEYKLLMLKDVNLEMCRGCYTCVLRDENKCPIKDDRDMIIQEILDADGVIFESPVYVNHITALLKNFIDRLGFYGHRPRFFDKFAVVMAVCGGFGADKANKYLKSIIGSFGFNVVSALEIEIGGNSEEQQKINREKMNATVDILLARVKKGERNKPTIMQLMIFHVFKLISEWNKKAGKADYAYYKDKTDYYYDLQVNPIKTMMAKWMAKRVLKM